MSDTVITITKADVQRAAQSISAVLPNVNPDVLSSVVESWLSDVVDALIAGAPHFAVNPHSGFSGNFFALLSGEANGIWVGGDGEVLTQTEELAELEAVVAAWQQDARDWAEEFGPKTPYPHNDTVADLEAKREALLEALAEGARS